jgi:beta-galactosidase
MPGFRRLLMRCLAIATFATPLLTPAAHAQRERIRISDDWRFKKGDPADLKIDLRYDVRPDVQRSADGRVADAQPEAAAVVSDSGARLLKPWILPSGNAFIADPARRHMRPAGDPGGNVTYVQPGFDDSAWQKVTLPHDWAITGPFLEPGP